MQQSSTLGRDLDPVGCEDEHEPQRSVRGGLAEQQKEGLKERQEEEVLWAKSAQKQLRTGGRLDLADRELHVGLGLENSSMFV